MTSSGVAAVAELLFIKAPNKQYLRVAATLLDLVEDLRD
jgi:hypothetical protein